MNSGTITCISTDIYFAAAHGISCRIANVIEALRGNRLMLRGIGLNEKELEILGISYAGE